VQEVIERETPHPKVADRFAFLLNNLVDSSLDTLAPEISAKLEPRYYHWFAHYLVQQKAANEPNYHPVYAQLLVKLDSRLLYKITLETSYEIVALIIDSVVADRADSSRRLMLKTLGTWIGKLTLARNMPVFRKHLDMRAVLLKGYRDGHLMAVFPFINKLIVEGVPSKVFATLRNPWVSSIMGLLREIYDLPSLKMALKFELESTSKAFGLKVDQIPRTANLVELPQVSMEANPDFKEWLPEKERLADKERRAADDGSAGSPAPAMDVFPSDEAPPRPPAASGGLAARRGSPSRAAAAAAAEEAAQLKRLHSLVVIPPELEQFRGPYNLDEVVPIAMDRAVSDTMMAAVERPVSISCKATSHIVLKDFVHDPSEARIRQAGRLMASSLAGSLALVTCRDALQSRLLAQFSSHLAVMQPAGVANAVGLVNDIAAALVRANHGVGCAYIEEVAMERSTQGIEEHLMPVRRCSHVLPLHPHLCWFSRPSSCMQGPACIIVRFGTVTVQGQWEQDEQ
jgi:CCR4-NOT transcription complex subunit 1